jgi:pentatricopeptide repeat protein
MSRHLCNQYAALLSSSAAAGRSWAHVAGAVHCLVLKTLPYPPVTYILNQLLTAYGKAGQVARARRLFDAIPSPNLFTYNALLSTLAHACHFSYMESLIASMPDRDVVSHNALIAGFSGGGSPVRAAGAYRALLGEENVRPSRITMSAMVMAALALADCALSRQVHCHTLQLGFGAYAFVVSPLLDMYAKMGMIQDANCVFGELEFKNTVMYNTMITGLLWCKMVGEALMTERDLITWTTMVTGLTHRTGWSRRFWMFLGG